MINKFIGKYDFLSNFYPCVVAVDGIKYKNAEAAFQAYKCINISDRYKFAGLDAGEAKKLGRQVTLRKDWEAVKDECMFIVLKAKFLNNHDLYKRLILTGNEELVEGNYWHDNYWGSCTCKNCANNGGKNNLGRLLMIVRRLGYHNDY